MGFNDVRWRAVCRMLADASTHLHHIADDENVGPEERTVALMLLHVTDLSPRGEQTPSRGAAR